MPCICTRTSTRSHRIQRYFSPPTTQAAFIPERLLTPPPSTLRTTFSLIESASQASTKESSMSEVCAQLGISKEKYSEIHNFLRDVVTEHFKPKTSYSKQTASAVKTALSKVKACYTCFEDQGEMLENLLKQQLKKPSKASKS
ncbi:hypothetical protein K443DRAFT_124178 [Laccaria amethystina LaAM-08-1]|uniref:Uncharacterized protein n=1 Tax=Laccaria amethystina LaAM-08-1 TaxID=1095629 RepID=A0A0C9XHJ7_9AGAR|nr:hypothetical protein K443DRAFT_124178 [Laccaria amethystina LaAM-08-1]